MDNICPDCQTLITGKHKKSHELLSLISTLPNSQLYKCTTCHAYLHCYDRQWEVLIEGYYNQVSDVENSGLQKLAMG